MESIREIYKIGNGPSSSHTIGPGKAGTIFKDKCPDAASYRVTLYGSLAATGKGHLTDKAIINSLAPRPTEIIWRADIVPSFHTNGMLFEGLDACGNIIRDWTVYSIGGGSLSEGEGAQPAAEIYEENTLGQIRQVLENTGMNFWEYVEMNEGKDIWDYLDKVWQQMQTTVKEGLSDDSVLPGELHLRSKAKRYFVRAYGLKDSLKSRALVSAYALAASEQNARGAVVVTAPTCGSCGVLPAVLFHVNTGHGFENMDILKALASAAIFGNVIKKNASLSGAEVGCQGEVGSACVMASVAITQLFGGTVPQIESAAEMAMEHYLGLTCDPVCGLVQIPCIERNAAAALRAMDASIYAILSDGNGAVSFDKVVRAMNETGHAIPSLYKETSLGGLAVTGIV